MSRTSFDQIVKGIDRHLSYLHKERWAEDHAKLREVSRITTDDAQERAKQVVRDRYKTQFRPETSRAALIEQARLNYDASNAKPFRSTVVTQEVLGIPECQLLLAKSVVGPVINRSCLRTTL